MGHVKNFPAIQTGCGVTYAAGSVPTSTSTLLVCKILDFTYYYDIRVTPMIKNNIERRNEEI
jgi:hypothetical protein